MIAFPVLAMVIASVCAFRMGWDAWRRPKPERVVWAIAFAVFAIAAGSEVLGSLVGWTPALARIYYLSGAVLVVGLLAIGELYLLFPKRMPSLTPGIALLIVAIAATTVFSAPVNSQALQTQGWAAIEKSPFLIALAASINAIGTVVLVGGALYSAWKLRTVEGSRQRLLGCVLIAAGAVIVASGGTLTRFGQREYLYVAMSLGVSTIFAGILLTRGKSRKAPPQLQRGAPAHEAFRPHLISFRGARLAGVGGELGAGIAFIAQQVLSRDSAGVEAFCRQWSSIREENQPLTRPEASALWNLRLQLPSPAQERLDALPVATQAQISELYDAVWSREQAGEGIAQRKTM